ncbi:MAG: hypothetical protein HYZ47_03870 [Simkania negevensis]|nr:hypothetical protein [Simkania negevensis]
MTKRDPYLDVFREGVLEALFNEELQEEAWGRGIWKRYVDYSEIIMSFMEICEIVLENAEQYGMTNEQKRLLQKLHDLVEAYDETVPSPPDAEYHKKILSDPRWHEIRNFARQVYETLGGDPHS